MTNFTELNLPVGKVEKMMMMEREKLYGLLEKRVDLRRGCSSVGFSLIDNDRF